MKIEEFDASSVLTLRFNDTMALSLKPYDVFLKEPQKFLKIAVKKNDRSQFADNPSNIASGEVLTMQVNSFDTREVKMQLQLSNPLYVSLDAFNPDVL